MEQAGNLLLRQRDAQCQRGWNPKEQRRRGDEWRWLVWFE